MFYVVSGKVFWLKHHYKFLHKKDMLKSKVLLGANTLKLKDGFNYITHQLNMKGTQIDPEIISNNFKGKVSHLIKAEAPKLQHLNKMAETTTGKEALQAIIAQHKAVKESAKVHSKNVTLFNKMVTKFPKKEKEAFADKLAKYTAE